jgi:hypothetical protein
MNSHLRFIRSAAHIAWLRYWDDIYPHVIGIEVSTACNKRCSYCAQSWQPAKQKIIAPHVWFQFVSRLAEFKWKGRVAIGGVSEPSLVKDLPRYIEDIRSIDAAPILFSNGTNPDAIEGWIRAGAVRVVLTEHDPWPESTHAALKSLKRAFPFRIKHKRLTPETIADYRHTPMTLNGKLLPSCPDPNLSFDINGAAQLCCFFSARTEPTGIQLGTLTSQSIHDLWFGEPWISIRYANHHGKPSLPYCQQCLGTNP